MLHANSIASLPTTARNPTGNAVSERVHKTIGDQLRTLVAEHPPATIAAANSMLDDCIASVTRALRSTVHSTLGMSPGSIVFHRDMLLPIPLLADYNLLREHRQAVIDDNARHANLRRHFKDYSPGDQSL